MIKARIFSVSTLKYVDLYQRLFDQYSEKTNGHHFYDVLLLVLIVQCIAVDTSICERGFSLMNSLKSAKRSRMGNELLRILMVICSLGGKQWKDDPASIPVERILSEWRAQSSRGRYEGAQWSADALQDGDPQSDDDAPAPAPAPSS